MKRFAIFVLLAAASVAGCTGSQSPNVPSVPAAAGSQAAHLRGKSWMLPGSKSGDLLYVTNSNHTVTVYSYPQGQLVGTLTGFETPFGACADKAGNVYITDYAAGNITEFAHGGTKPIRSLRDPEYRPQGCSIDPATGNLGVANYETGWNYPGNLSVYKKAKGYPLAYIVYDFYYYWFGAYDGGGNLYTDGQFSQYGQNFEFAQLPKKRGVLTQMSLPANIGYPGSIAWDGTYLAVGDQSSLNVYEFAIAKGKATLHNTTALGGAAQIVAFTIDGSTLIGANQGNSGSSVLFYSYPAGGSPTLTITDSVDYPKDVAVSHVGSN